MDSEYHGFVRLAQPHSWLQTADRLHDQAIKLKDQLGDQYITVIDHGGGSSQTWFAGNTACFLLAGFALENAIKAFLVYENPNWISNGKLSGRLRSHSLMKLQKQSTQIPYRSRLLWVLTSLEQGLESWARYPCGLSMDDSPPERHMTDELWEGYRKVARAYGRRLAKLLARKWYGPHGWGGGYYKLQGKLPLS